MPEILIIEPPKETKSIKGCWSAGFPIHKGESNNSLNYATVYANKNSIIPDVKIINKDYANFAKTLTTAGFKLTKLPFPKELNDPDNLHHDAIFVRDAGLMTKDYWIKARFSAKDRQAEAEVHAKTISKKFNKKIIELPKDSFLEFGEVFYLKTKDKTYYFGGVSRSNKQAHDFVKSILKPDTYILIESEGYHLDTVFSPVINKNNELVALILTKGMIAEKSLKELKNLGLEIIYVDSTDSSGEGKTLGNYAINTLVAPGILANCSKFETKGIEERLETLEIKRFVSPMTYHRFAGGSYHCLTNEIN
jgi:N-dimethylarginine dimethylaminohydrolase